MADPIFGARMEWRDHQPHGWFFERKKRLGNSMDDPVTQSMKLWGCHK
jgi:hypothetical protein